MLILKWEMRDGAETYREDLVLVGRERWEGEGDGEGSHSLHIRGGALSLKKLSASGENDDEEEAVELLAGSARYSRNLSSLILGFWVSKLFQG